MTGVTDTKALRDDIQARREKEEADTAAALLEVLNTAAGRRVWLWIRDELCALRSASPGGHPSDMARFEGKRDVALAMERVLTAHPDVRIALAMDRAAADRDLALYQAALHRLGSIERKTEETTWRTR